MISWNSSVLLCSIGISPSSNNSSYQDGYVEDDLDDEGFQKSHENVEIIDNDMQKKEVLSKDVAIINSKGVTLNSIIGTIQSLIRRVQCSPISFVLFICLFEFFPCFFAILFCFAFVILQLQLLLFFSVCGRRYLAALILKCWDPFRFCGINTSAYLLLLTHPPVVLCLTSPDPWAFLCSLCIFRVWAACCCISFIILHLSFLPLGYYQVPEHSTIKLSPAVTQLQLTSTSQSRLPMRTQAIKGGVVPPIFPPVRDLGSMNQEATYQHEQERRGNIESSGKLQRPSDHRPHYLFTPR